MKGFKVLLVFCFLSAYSFTQESIVSEATETITIAELRDHIFYLASDELEGRLTGTPGFEKASQYVVSQLRQAGLTPFLKTDNAMLTYYQYLMLNKYSPGLNNQITIMKDTIERTFSFEDNFLVVYGMGPVETKEISGGLAFVGAGIRELEYGIDDYKNIDAKGKWVILTAPPEALPIAIKRKLPHEILQKYETSLIDKRRIIEQNAKDAGAIGIISISSNNLFNSLKRGASVYHDLYTFTEDSTIRYDSLIPSLSYDILLPFIYIDSSMVDYLFNGEKYSPDIINKESYATFMLKNSELKFLKEYSFSTVYITNITALIEGSDLILKNEYITLGAHLDHLGIQNGEVMNGADDNASGCAGVLEIAEAIAKSRPKRSVICILYTGEELGHLGSIYFIENPPVPLKRIIANINLDMIGRSNTDTKGLAPLIVDTITLKLKEVIQKVNDEKQYVTLDWDYTNTNPFVLSKSDNYSFVLKNIPVVWFLSGRHSDYHTPLDEADKIDYEFLQKTCKLTYEIIFELANSNAYRKE